MPPTNTLTLHLVFPAFYSNIRNYSKSMRRVLALRPVAIWLVSRLREGLRLLGVCWSSRRLWLGRGSAWRFCWGLGILGIVFQALNSIPVHHYPIWVGFWLPLNSVFYSVLATFLHQVIQAQNFMSFFLRFVEASFSSRKLIFIAMALLWVPLLRGALLVWIQKVLLIFSENLSTWRIR